MMSSIHLYYLMRPLIPRAWQIGLRRMLVRRRQAFFGHSWPILEAAGRAPEGWRGWPDQKKFSVVLTHDVDTQRGHDRSTDIMILEERLGFRSSFSFVPERYIVSKDLRTTLTDRGFEVGVHGLYHDGKLFKSEEIFMKRAPRINEYMKEWGAAGFRSPSMHQNLQWIRRIDLQYDSSTFDTDPFEPQPEGTKTIFPFWVPGNRDENGYVELPYTIPQDFTLFVLMKEEGIDIWKRKLDWIAERGGMALINTHPDYMNVDERKLGIEEYPLRYYEEFLNYVKERYEGQYWQPLPREVAADFKARYVSADPATGSVPASSVVSVQRKKKVWIDLDNSPHVPFFHPIIRSLHDRGYEVIVSVRDAFQVRELAELAQMPHTSIGRHYGKNKIAKVLGLFGRALQLAPFVLREKPDLAVSHGSRSQIILSSLLRIPKILIADYEHVKHFPLMHPTVTLVPDIIPDGAATQKETSLRKYPGIKEDVYVPSFTPNAAIQEELDLSPYRVVVTLRPPATEAHYHNPESEILFSEVMSLLGARDDVKTVLLPRNKRQEEWIRQTWPDEMGNGRMIVPAHATDGLNLVWFSDLVISGGGTMNREAAALGVPVYSIFRGTIGAVDRYLSENGRLTLLESVEDVRSKVELVPRDKPEVVPNVRTDTLDCIVDEIIAVVEQFGSNEPG